MHKAKFHADRVFLSHETASDRIRHSTLKLDSTAQSAHFQTAEKAIFPPGGISHLSNSLLLLQPLIGNRAVQRMVAGSRQGPSHYRLAAVAAPPLYGKIQSQTADPQEVNFSTQQEQQERSKRRIDKVMKNGWRQVRLLDAETLQAASAAQRVKMLVELMLAYWTGGKEEECIIRILATTPQSQASALLRALTDHKIDGQTLLAQLDRVVDLGNNLEMHAVLSILRLKGMGAEKATEALASAPILPWHDVMGLFEDDATFFVSQAPKGKIRIKYPVRVRWAKDFGDEPKRLSQTMDDIYLSGHDFSPDQMVVIHDYDQGRFIPIAAQELIGYKHAGMRGFLSNVATVASLPFGGGAGAAKTALGRVLIRVSQVLTGLSLLAAENRLKIVKWFPNWGPKMLYYLDLVSIGINVFGVMKFIGGGGLKLVKAWRKVRHARQAMEGVDASTDAHKMAAMLEKQADELFSEVDKLSANQKQSTVNQTASPTKTRTPDAKGIELPRESPEAFVLDPTAYPSTPNVPIRRPQGFKPTGQGSKQRVKAGTLEGLESHRHKPARKRRGKSLTREEQLAGIESRGTNPSKLVGKRPPLPRGKAPYFSGFRRFSEGFHRPDHVAEQKRILELAREAPQQAGREYQQLVAADLNAVDVQEFSKREGRRIDIGTNHEVTIEGHHKAFGTHKLDQLWNDLEHEGIVLLTVPRLSPVAAAQLHKLGIQAEKQFGKRMLILIRETLP